jgi:RNA polymerase sigma factor FliA
MSILIYQEMKGSVDQREQRIIELYFDYGYKEREIAVMMEVSRPRISQIKNRAIEKMREYVQ